MTQTAVERLKKMLVKSQEAVAEIKAHDAWLAKEGKPSMRRVAKACGVDTLAEHESDAAALTAVLAALDEAQKDLDFALLREKVHTRTGEALAGELARTQDLLRKTEAALESAERASRDLAVEFAKETRRLEKALTAAQQENADRERENKQQAAGAWRPRVVCLCGSTRFREAFEAASRAEGLAGRITLTVSCFGHSGDLPAEACIDGHPTKTMLDELHKRKIDLADEILVVNVGGYIGTSTRSEIAYAEQHGKPVRYLEAVQP